MTHHLPPRSAVLPLLALLLAPSLRAAPIPLRYTYRAGEAAHYRLSMESRTAVQIGELSQETQLRTVLNLVQRTVAVGEDGIARVLTRVESGQVTDENGSRQMMPPREATMRLNARGAVLDGMMPESRLAPLRMVFPEEGVQIGSSWTASQPPSPEIPVPVQVRYTVVGFREYEERSCIEIQVRIQAAEASAVENPMQMGFQATGAMLFDFKEGLLIRSEIESDLELTLQRPPALGLEDVKTHIETDFSIRYLPGL